MSKWETMHQLVKRMPGGKYIPPTWVNEELVDVEIVFDERDVDPEQDYSFAANVLIAAIAEWGPPSDDEFPDTLRVPPLVEEMLEFWSDGEIGYYVEG